MKRRFIVMALSGCLLAAAPTAAFAHSSDDVCGRSHGGIVVNQYPGHGGPVVLDHSKVGRHGGTVVVRGARPNHGGPDCDGDFDR